MNVLRRLRKKPLSLFGLALIGFFASVAVLAPVLAPPDPSASVGARLLDAADDPFQAARNWGYKGAGLLSKWGVLPESDWTPPYEKDAYLIPQEGYSPDPRRPDGDHWFGTTEQQYDLYYGLVWGTRTAFSIGVKIVTVALLIGVFIGTVSGYYGGWVDEVLMRFTDIILAFPGIVLAVVIVAVSGPGLDNVVLAISLVAWPSFARLVRGDVLSVKEREFVLAARALGATDARIMLRHILPNSIYPVLVVASLDIGSVVITAAALSFLGLGAPVGYADWGQLISLSRNWILGATGSPFEFWHTVFFPGAAIFFFVLGWNLLGDAFRDILDPRQKG